MGTRDWGLGIGEMRGNHKHPTPNTNYQCPMPHAPCPMPDAHL
ncbi:MULTISPECIES: hypothetical protein [unclassified Tolypothrix]|nr:MULTISPECIES: hypothetical protein [unclassified Tolypothrix]